MLLKRGHEEEAPASAPESAFDSARMQQFLDCCAAADPAALAAALAEQPALAAATHPETSWTGLHAATKAGQLSAVQTLLGARCDPSACTHHDSNALHIAACNGKAGRQADVAKLLIEAGCPLEARDNRGNTPLLRACQHGADLIAAALLAAGADRTAANADGQTCEARAAAGGHESVTSLLAMFGQR